MRTVNKPTSREIGFWLRSAGPPPSTRQVPGVPQQQQNLPVADDQRVRVSCRWPPIPTAIPADLKLLRIGCPTDKFDGILGCIYIPQFKNLDTIYSSLTLHYIEAAVTDDSGHAFGFSQFIGDGLNFHPLRHFGAVIMTLRLDQSLRRLDEPAAY